MEEDGPGFAWGWVGGKKGKFRNGEGRLIGLLGAKRAREVWDRGGGNREKEDQEAMFGGLEGQQAGWDRSGRGSAGAMAGRGL